MLGVVGGLLGPRALRLVSAFLGVIALVVAAGAISATVTDIDLRANGVTTNATVLTVETLRNYSSSSKMYTTTYTDRVQYTMSDGVQHQASVNDSGSLRTGDTVAIVYDPSHLSTAQEKSTLTGVWWIGVTAFFLFALALGWISVSVWRKASRTRDADLPASTLPGL